MNAGNDDDISQQVVTHSLRSIDSTVVHVTVEHTEICQENKLSLTKSIKRRTSSSATAASIQPTTSSLSLVKDGGRLKAMNGLEI